MTKRVTEEAYERAENLILENTKGDVLNGFIKPNWIGEAGVFWYEREVRVDGEVGKKFILVDPINNTIEEAFNHSKLASILSSEFSIECTEHNLPFNDLEFINEKNAIQFLINDEKFVCNLSDYECVNENYYYDKVLENEVVSPDGKLAVYMMDYNLFMKGFKTGKITQLTFDGEFKYDYASYPGNRLTGLYEQINKIELKPAIKWSKDSKKILTYRVDQRYVKEAHIVQSVPLNNTIRPSLYSYPYPLPGDDYVPKAEVVVCDIESGEVIKVNTNPVVLHPKSLFDENSQLIGWSEDNDMIYIIRISEDHQTVQFELANLNTGEVKQVFEEKSDTFLHFDRHNFGDTIPGQEYIKPNFYLFNNNSKVIWHSERDGWSHLYLYDCKTCNLINQITVGPWVVRRLLEVDEANEWLYFTAGGKEEGRDPYLQHLYRIKFDGTRMELLTPEDAEHIISFSPDLKYFVDNFSRIDLAPKSVLRSVDGSWKQNLEEANIDKLLDKGFQMPTRFVVKARDGITDIHGVMVCPGNLESEGKYPVIDYVYGGPQRINVPKFFMFARKELNEQRDLLGGAQEFAQLGFVTVIIDGFGTPYRSKSFHDYSFGRLQDAAGLEDHVTGIKQLAEKYKFIDLDRVGTWGLSGGGYASTRGILTYPDFYKVAVSAAGNHDNRMYNSLWGDRYQGKGASYVKQDNAILVKNLKGKLFLAHGDADDNVHPAQTIRMVDALINENKDFDLLILPNRHHALVLDLYFKRKKWDYFVKNLLGAEPPNGYVMRQHKKEEAKKQIIIEN